MPVPVYTLNAVGVNESNQTLAQWGFTDPILTINSQSPSEFSIRAPGVNLFNQSIIPYFTLVRVYRDGGKMFEGRQVNDQRIARARGSADVISFLDAWYELSVTPFQQLWNYRPNAASPLISKRFSRYNLFQDFVTAALITNGQQITEILNYAIQQCGINLQVGVIEPNSYLPILPARAMMCGQAILEALKPSPDAVTYIDYATTPPTFHCRLRKKANGSTTLTTVTMPFSGRVNGVIHESSDIQTRYDLIADQVVIDYKKVSTFSLNGVTQTFVNFDTDAYPAGSNGQSPGAIVLPVDLAGAAQANLQGTITAAAFSVFDLTWWARKHHHFADGRVTNLAILGDFGNATHPITVRDEQGNNINLNTYPNELIKGTINSWMQVGNNTPAQVIDATVTAWFSWTETDPNGIETKKHNDSQITVRVKLTNSPIGDATYQTTGSIDTGEFQPPNLAQNIWRALQQLQYEGEHVVREQDPTYPMQILGPWNLLNLSGGLAEWAAMNAAIQSVTHDFFAGRTNIRIGPASHIQPGDKAQLMIWARGRLVLENPSVRTSGQTSGSGSVDVGRDTPKENTTSGIANPKFSAVSKYDPVQNKNVMLHLDGENKEIRMSEVDIVTKQPDANKMVSMLLEDTKGSDGQYHKVTLKEIVIYDATCQAHKVIILMSDLF